MYTIDLAALFLATDIRRNFGRIMVNSLKKKHLTLSLMIMNCLPSKQQLNGKPTLSNLTACHCGHGVAPQYSLQSTGGAYIRIRYLPFTSSLLRYCSLER